MAARLFVVTIARGPEWDRTQPVDGQTAWDAHAAFMNALVDEGLVLLGGPLEGTPDEAHALLVMRAETPEVIRSRLATDPWHRMNLLGITSIVPWTLRLGSL